MSEFIPSCDRDKDADIVKGGSSLSREIGQKIGMRSKSVYERNGGVNEDKCEDSSHWVGDSRSSLPDLKENLKTRNLPKIVLRGEKELKHDNGGEDVTRKRKFDCGRKVLNKIKNWRESDSNMISKKLSFLKKNQRGSRRIHNINRKHGNKHSKRLLTFGNFSFRDSTPESPINQISPISGTNRVSTEMMSPMIVYKSIRRIKSFLPQNFKKVYLSTNTGHSSQTSLTQDRKLKLSTPRRNKIKFGKFMKKKYQLKTSKKSLKGKNAYSDKTNQDRNLVHQFTIDDTEITILAVADGHGMEGHKASEVVIQSLVFYAEKLLKEIKEDLLKPKEVKEVLKDIPRLIQRVLEKSKEELEQSGTTLVFALVIANHLYLCNVGDSRAFLASKVKGRLSLTMETVDHLPHLEEERRRIEEARGRVCPCINANGDYSGPDRVWDQAMTGPGLAMSRSLGDFYGHEIGLSCEIEIFHKKLEMKDKFIVLGSDGIWDFLSSEVVMKIIWPYYVSGRVEEGSKILMKRAKQEWKKVSSTTRDDITCVVALIS